MTFPFGSDISMDFQVGIQTIAINKTQQHLLSAPIVSYISTLVPDIWLPFDACAAFQDAFHLSYSNDTETFYINSTQHAKNLVSNPIVSFHVGPEISGAWVVINMPYWNFYLAANVADTNTIIGEGGFRFPIRRAAKDTQYVLGRAFLQSAYLTADYERNIFNLSQAIYPSSSTKEDIVPILPLGMSSQDPSVTAATPTRLNTTVIAGIAIGVAVTLASIAAIVFIFYRRKKKFAETGYELEDTDVLSNMRHELPDNEKRHEVGAALKHETAGDTDYKAELYGLNEQEKPSEVADAQVQFYELPANEKITTSRLKAKGTPRERSDITNVTAINSRRQGGISGQRALF